MRQHFRHHSETLRLVISVQPPPLTPCSAMKHTTIPDITLSPPEGEFIILIHLGDINDVTEFRDLFYRG